MEIDDLFVAIKDIRRRVLVMGDLVNGQMVLIKRRCLHLHHRQTESKVSVLGKKREERDYRVNNISWQPAHRVVVVTTNETARLAKRALVYFRRLIN